MPRFTTSANCTGTLSAAQKTPETARPRSETQPEWGKRGRPPPAMRGPEAATPRITRYSATASPLRICTRNNRAFRVEFGNKGGVGPVSPCRADVLRPPPFCPPFFHPHFYRHNIPHHA